MADSHALMRAGPRLHAHTTHRLATINARQVSKGKRLTPGHIRRDHPFRDQAIDLIVTRSKTNLGPALAVKLDLGKIK